MDNCRAAWGMNPSGGECRGDRSGRPVQHDGAIPDMWNRLRGGLSDGASRSVGLDTLPDWIGHIARLDRATRPVAPTLPACSFYQNDIISPVLTSHFPDSAFSGNAHFRNFVPSGKSCVKYFKIHPSERIGINRYSHKYTVSNAKKASFALLSTVESTGGWLRTDERLPSYRRVRTVVVVRPYENRHLFSLFRARRGTISDV